MVLEIKTFPDEILRKVAIKIENVDDEIKQLVTNMVDTMREAHGYGLAAPQVGVSKRIIIADDTLGKDPSRLMAMINPIIIKSSGDQYVEEGCLSIPGEYAYVKRFLNVTVQFLDKNGKEVTLDAEGNMARIVQHEIDHLDGHLFLDKLNILKRDSIKKSIKRRIKEGDYTVTSTAI